MTRSTSFYVRNIAAIILIVGVALWAGVAGTLKAQQTESGFVVLVLGFMSGLVPITTEFIIAARKHELFIQSKAQIRERRSRNKRLAKESLIPGIGLGVVFTYFSADWQIFLMALFTGYILPFGVGLAIHFAKNHQKIKKLTST